MMIPEDFAKQFIDAIRDGIQKSAEETKRQIHERLEKLTLGTYRLRKLEFERSPHPGTLYSAVYQAHACGYNATVWVHADGRIDAWVEIGCDSCIEETGFASIEEAKDRCTAYVHEQVKLDILEEVR